MTVRLTHAGPGPRTLYLPSQPGVGRTQSGGIVPDWYDPEGSDLGLPLAVAESVSEPVAPHPAYPGPPDAVWIAPADMNGLQFPLDGELFRSWGYKYVFDVPPGRISAVHLQFAADSYAAFVAINENWVLTTWVGDGWAGEVDVGIDPARLRPGRANALSAGIVMVPHGFIIEDRPTCIRFGLTIELPAPRIRLTHQDAGTIRLMHHL